MIVGKISLLSTRSFLIVWIFIARDFVWVNIQQYICSLSSHFLRAYWSLSYCFCVSISNISFLVFVLPVLVLLLPFRLSLIPFGLRGVVSSGSVAVLWRGSIHGPWGCPAVAWMIALEWAVWQQGLIRTSCVGVRHWQGGTSFFTRFLWRDFRVTQTTTVMRQQHMCSKLAVVAGKVLTYVCCKLWHCRWFEVIDFIHGRLKACHSRHRILCHVINQTWQGVSVCGDVFQVLFDLWQIFFQCNPQVKCTII